MMARLSLASAAVVCIGLSGLFGCHAGGDPPTTIDGNGSGGSGGSGSDGALPVNFEELVSRTFTVSPGEDGYRCIRIQAPDEMWINAFEPLPDTQGVHHQILTVTTPTSGTPQLGAYPCDASTAISADDMQMLYAAGMGTDALALPDGYAVHVQAGTYLNLAVHVYNPGDTAITNAKAGVMVKRLAVGSTLPKEVDFMFNGTRQISLQYNAAPGTMQKLSGSCSVPRDWTIFALWPHMHARGVQISFEVQHSGGGTQKLLDNVAYAYGSEQFYPMATPVAVAANDTLMTTCTWDNNATNNPNHNALHYGPSAADEMCFTGFYKYPAGNYDLYYCAPN